VPVAAALNVAVWPAVTARLAGCVVIVGAAELVGLVCVDVTVNTAVWELPRFAPVVPQP